MNEQVDKFEGAKKAKVLSAVAVAAILLATLWPLNPVPKNGVTWLSGTSGVKFERAGLVVSKEVLDPPGTEASQSYTLELLLRPRNIRLAGTILAFYSPTRTTQLEVNQWRNILLVTHDARVESDSTHAVKFDVDNVLHPGKLVFVAVSSGRNGTTVYVDGQPAESFPRFEIARSELLGEIVLGTSATGYEPWKGELKGVATYAKELTPEEAAQHYRGWVALNGHPPADLSGAMARYTFTEAAGTEIHNEVASGPDLTIPAAFRVPHKAFLESPAQDFRANRSYAYDVVTNIAGFIPLGMIICSYLAWTKSRWKTILMTICFCGLLSFAIETTQYYIPRRGSGITDIMTNTLGAALGAVLVQLSFVGKLLRGAGLLPTSRRPPMR